ncbi:MAG: hypothetical protein JWM68_5637 [Verrucomicrobiales bacterium]|nr:hypothetical protein [Verrucomicrobiales bacterium]
MKPLFRYLEGLSRNRIILWCYFIWYLVILVRYFEASSRLWLTSFGLSAIIGIALYLSSTTNGSKPERWQTIRLFMMPFCVSSFSALVKGKNFILIFSPDPKEDMMIVVLIGMFLGIVALLKARKKSRN